MLPFKIQKTNHASDVRVTRAVTKGVLPMLEAHLQQRELLLVIALY